jgi:hypothetical protein
VRCKIASCFGVIGEGASRPCRALRRSTRLDPMIHVNLALTNAE